MNKDTQAAPPAGGTSSVVVDTAVRLALVGLLAAWALHLIAPFIAVALWGVILAVALHPVFDWLRKRIGGHGKTAAVIVTLVLVLIVFGPTSLLSAGLIENLQSLSGRVEAGTLRVPPPFESVRDWPIIGEQLYQTWELASTNLGDVFTRFEPQLKSLGKGFLSTAAGAGIGIIQFVVAAVIAGFLFVPADHLVKGVRAFAKRLAAQRGDLFVDLAGATIRNVARGVIGIALLQSLLIGIGLLVAGIPAAGLLTFIALILGIVQIGPGIVILGALIWAWTSLDVIGALAFTVYFIPVGLLDNILKPIVMSRGLSTPMLVIFIGVIGGTLAHGIIGLFVGPIILAVVYELIVVWVREDEAGEAPQAAKDTAPGAGP